MTESPADYFCTQFVKIFVRHTRLKLFLLGVYILQAATVLCVGWSFQVVVSDSQWLLIWALHVLCFALFTLWGFRLRKQRTPDAAALRKHLLLHYDRAQTSPHEEGRSSWEEWTSWVEGDLKQSRDQSKQHVFKYVLANIALLICIFLSGGTFVFAAASGAYDLGRWVLQQPDQYTLTVLAGSVEAKQGPHSYSLTVHEPLRLDLSSSNLLELSLNTQTWSTFQSAEENKNVVLRIAYESGTPDQLLLLHPVTTDEGTPPSAYQVQFSLYENARIYVQAFSGQKPLGVFQILRRPVPKVHLATAADLTQPWPDDQPLSLQVRGSGQHALGEVTLEMRIGERIFTELVASLQKEGEQKSFTLDYDVVLEPYLQSDQAEVELRIKLSDLAVPIAGVGYSNVVMVQTQSAYGRYRDALASLRELKGQLDIAFADQQPIPTPAFTLMEEALAKSGRTPFFDALDRVEIDHIYRNMSRLQSDAAYELVLETKNAVDQFLKSHEVLDDQERDQDFFVAARALSRLLEQPVSERVISVDKAVHNLVAFVEERMERWQLRVAFLNKHSGLQTDGFVKLNAAWAEITDSQRFTFALQQVASLADQHRSNVPAQNKLRHLIQDYQSWIDQLREMEDAFREQQEQKRQQGIASAANQLRDLQVAQGKISTQLDQADRKDFKELKAKWPSLRMKQNSIMAEAKKVEYSLRTLMPFAADRVKYAVQAMDKVLLAGESSKFAIAESAADLAGRLLRHANNASQRAQRRSGRRRRRRISGDRYYGQSVHGGDLSLEHDYQVDRRYREHVLESIERAKQKHPEEQEFLDRYLKELIR